MHFYKSRLAIIIEDERANIIHVYGCKLLLRKVIKENDFTSILELQDYIKQQKCCCVHILLNCSRQDYQCYNLHIPFTNNKNFFLQNLLPKEILNKATFVDSVLLDKEKDKYLIFTPQITSDFVNLSKEIENRFKGFCFAPLECKQIIDILSLGMEIQNAKNKFEILIMHHANNRLQLILYKNKIFSKNEVIILGEHKNLSVYAGSIKQYFDSFVATLALGNDCMLNTYIVLPDKIKLKLMLHKFTQKNVIILSPYEVAIILNLDCFMKKDDPCCDVIIAHNVINNGHSNYLFNFAEEKKKRKINISAHCLNTTTVILVIIFICFIFTSNNTTYHSYQEHKLLIEQNHFLQSTIERELKLFDPKKVKFNYINKLILLDDTFYNDEALQYLLNMNKYYYDDIINSSYDTRNTKSTSVKINTKNCELIKEKENKNLLRLSVEVCNEEDIH